MKLLRTLNYSIEKYGTDAVLCAAQSSISSAEAVVILIPALEDICFGNPNRIVETPEHTFQTIGIQSLLTSINFFGRVIINPRYEEEYKSYFSDKDNIQQIKTGILNLVRNRTIVTDNYEIFIQSLTFTEVDALDEIKDKIGGEGTISINSLSKETGISRPVFNNLLNKMSNTKVAEVQNMGARGTYIKIINEKLL